MNARRLFAVIVLAVTGAACTPATAPSSSSAPAPHPADAWVAQALAGHPTLQAELAAVPNVWMPAGSYWAATAWSPFTGARIAWNTAAPDWDHEQRLDTAAHEAGHVLAMARWLVLVWPSNGVDEWESFADCFATAVRGHPVAGHGGCTGDPTAAFYAVATTPAQYVNPYTP